MISRPKGGVIPSLAIRKQEQSDLEHVDGIARSDGVEPRLSMQTDLHPPPASTWGKFFLDLFCVVEPVSPYCLNA